MKRTFLFLAAFAVVATSCSKNTLVDTPSVVYDASTINFAPSTGLSKANNNNGLVSVQTGFEVFALIKDKDSGKDKMYFTDPAQTGNNTYTNTGADADGKGGTWAWGSGDSDDKKWPTEAKNYPMTFLATYPAIETPNTPLLSANYGGGTLNWEVAIQQGTSTDQTVDYLSATTIQPAAPMFGQLATLNFKHIMSQIKFSVNIPTGYTAYVTRAIYHNLHNANTYNFLTQTWDSTKVAPTFNYPIAGREKYTVENATATVQELKSSDDRRVIQSADSLFVLPQYFAKAWDLDAFKKAATDWKDANKADDWDAYPAAVDALASGTYVELQYALVDDNGVCLVGRINGKKYIDAAGDPQVYTGKDQFLRVAYLVDLSKTQTADKTKSKFISDLKQGKKYTYQIALGTPDATGGTVLDPNYVEEDGTTPGGDSGKEPGDDVNNKASHIGFSVSVTDWTDAGDSKDFFEPTIPVTPAP